MLEVNAEIQIPLSEFQFTYVRSSGPGGQNVNKVNTKAQMRWPVTTSQSLPPAVRERFLAKYRTRVTEQGDLLIVSQRYRDQGRNVDDCFEKLRAMLLEVAIAPKRRKKTKPGRGAIERRLKQKRHKTEKKQGRQAPGDG